MLRQPDGIRKYRTAHDRFLKPAIVNFFKREFSGYFGPIVCQNIADALIDIFEKNAPQTNRIKHGQVLWNALDKNTRADSPNRRYVPVVLSLVTDEVIDLFEKEQPAKQIRKQLIARIIREAYDQGGILSTRDISLIMATNADLISRLRIEYETENNTVLPHTGVMHDMGSTITHKVQIVYKHVVEKKSTNTVARETNHSQKAVDHYINNYHRVKALVDDKKDIEFIHLATRIAKPVILQYQNIINNYVKDR
jgi:predicted nuclease of predicted toxin-antitoxin system